MILRRTDFGKLRARVCVLLLVFISGAFGCRDPYEDLEQEKAWAAGVRKQYEAGLKCARTKDAEYLKALTAELALAAEPNPYQFEVCLSASEELNAYAFPAGFLVINAGLLNAVQEESELASVVGHEISHVILRHSFHAERKRQWGSRFFGSMKNPALRIPSELFGAVGMLKYSREHEKYADMMGIETAARAGFDPRGAIAFFEKLERLEFQRFPLLTQMLSTHPRAEERLKYIRRQINRMENKSYRENSKGFLEMKKRYTGAQPVSPRL